MYVVSETSYVLIHYCVYVSCSTTYVSAEKEWVASEIEIESFLLNFILLYLAISSIWIELGFAGLCIYMNIYVTRDKLYHGIFLRMDPLVMTKTFNRVPEFNSVLKQKYTDIFRLLVFCVNCKYSTYSKINMDPWMYVRCRYNKIGALLISVRMLVLQSNSTLALRTIFHFIRQILGGTSKNWWKTLGMAMYFSKYTKK